MHDGLAPSASIKIGWQMAPTELAALESKRRHKLLKVLAMILRHWIVL